ncbi:MAG: Si-specific NAD(P)(+) transhydrogenase [Verrucomicrobiota bacterium]
MDFDLIVIGSGPAGEKGAAQAAYFGKKVALLEKENFPGGAAANTGTLPSKTLRETALHLSGFHKRELYGMAFDFDQRINAENFLRHFQNVRALERERIGRNMERHGIESLQGTGSFLDANTVLVTRTDGTTRAITASKFLIATGTRPHHPADYPWHDPRLLESDTVLNISRLPEKMLVIGGGVIGSEYACIFAALGVEVMLVDGRDRLLGFLDAEVSEALQQAMRGMGIDLRLGEGIESIASGENLEAVLKSGGVHSFDCVLAASGRQGNTSSMGLEKIGIQPDKRGLLKVNAHFQTGLSHIYAAGDVIGFPALASTSMEQGRVAMCHAFDLKYKTDLARILPLGIYTIPECSCAGETEESLRAKKIPYVVGRTRYSQNSRGFIIGDKEGFLKLLFHADDMKLLGIHVLGEEATDLVHIGLTALLLGQTASIFIDTCYNYPTLSEMYKYAAYDALGHKQRGETVRFPA